MTKWTADLALQLWYDALEQENGLVIPIKPEDAQRIEVDLYTARVRAEDPRLSVLSITKRREGTELWIWRKPENRLDD